MSAPHEMTCGGCGHKNSRCTCPDNPRLGGPDPGYNIGAERPVSYEKWMLNEVNRMILEGWSRTHQGLVAESIQAILVSHDAFLAENEKLRAERDRLLEIVDAYMRHGAVLLDERDEAQRSLMELRHVWNKHMDSCPQHAALPDLPHPSWEDLEAWRNAPSDTASADYGATNNG